MAFLIMNPPSLARLCDSDALIARPELAVEDCRDYHDTYDGDGVWIPSFLGFLEKVVSERCHLPRFAFHDTHAIRESQFDEIPSNHVRALLIDFTNYCYMAWREDDIDLPDYDDVRSDCRDYCDDCEYAYETIYGTYDGPLAEDVDDDEDESDPAVSKQERHERLRRNREREAERKLRQQAQENAESEAVDSEWICDTDCDSFLDHVSSAYSEAFDGGIPALEKRFEQFLIERGEKDFPPLIVELAQLRQ